MKICTKCKGDPKSLSEFYLNKRTGRYHSRCKLCSKIAVREGRKDNLEKHKKANVRKQKRINGNPKKYGIKFMEANLKHNYRITLDQYNLLFLKQEGKCAICGIHQKDLKRALAIDHDHKTRKIRGLLCTQCNIGLGMFKDNPKVIQRAVNYLKQY